MRDGFVRVGAWTTAVRVADVDHNVDQLVAAARSAAEVGDRVIVLPELAVTAYTCEDLFWQDALLDAAEAGVARFARETVDVDALLLVGAPVRMGAKLYNCAAVVCRGRILGLVPKRNIPTYNEFYEGRHFCAGPEAVTYASFAGQEVPFGARQLFRCATMPQLVVGVEVCEDLWVPNPPSTALAQAGATLVCNLSASNELVGKGDYRRSLVSSTSARLVCAYAYASAGWGESSQDLVFGGHDLVCENGRVLDQAQPLEDEALGCELREISIAAAVRQHFSDIGHDEADRSVTYENAQARERTQILMDVANQEGGLVVGTGDLSELALGWATYNADHMSMYGVNAGVPKTLVRHLVRCVADGSDDALRRVLLDVLDTPVSPELLPATDDGKIAQKTEDLVGPYELHDFFLYNVLRCGFGPAKVYRLALVAFGGRYSDAVAGCGGEQTSGKGEQASGDAAAAGSESADATQHAPDGTQVGTYDAETIMKWLRKFYWRFFSQQFKRSCLPDGPKVGTVAVSPRGDLRMPSDAVCALWQKELDGLAG